MKGRVRMIAGLNQKTVKIGKWNVRLSDLAFLAVFGVLAAYFIVNAPYGITVCDESLFQLYPYRLMRGDRLFIDDWMISNLVSVYTYLPYRAFVALTGGTQGLLLFLRYVYSGIKLILMAYVYLALRKNGYWAILAAAIFVGTDLFGLKTLSYYFVCLTAVALAGMLLFVPASPGRGRRISAGFLFGCAVLAEPPAALVWAAYCALALVFAVLKKRGKTRLDAYGFILSPKVWRDVFIGVLLSAAVFFALCAALFTGTDLKAIFAGLGQTLRYVSYDNGTGGDTLLIRLAKPLMYALYCGVYFVVPFAVIGVILLIPCRFSRTHRRSLFAALCVLYMLISVHLILFPAHRISNDASGESVIHPLPICLLAAAAYALTENKNRKLFSFLLLSFSVSGAVDLFSNNSMGSVLLCGCIPAVLLLRDFIREQLAAPAVEKKRVKKNASYQKRYRAVLCALLAFIPVFECWHWIYMARMHETEHFFRASEAPLNARISSGLLKGIVTTAELKENCEKSVRDAGKLKQICKNGLIVVDYDTTVYQNAGLPVYTPATHIVGNDWSTEEAWWRLHPEKRPDAAYIPYFTLSYIEFNDISAEEKLAYFQKNADITVTEGEIGYLVKIERWHF